MSFNRPLPAPRPLLDLESPYTPAQLAPELATTAREALEVLQADLQLLATTTMPAPLQALAEELHGTATQLVEVAQRFKATAEAAT